ncbi:unnamed protein product, partial [Meganyctiphanes norvegica]
YCHPECVNGNCTNPNTCTCEEGFMGEICDIGFECPTDFTKIESQCFKIISNKAFQFGRAKVECEHDGLILGEPKTNTVFIKLAEYAIGKDSAGDFHYWLGARGDGASLIWENRDATVPANVPWQAGQPEGLSSEWCLDLRADSMPIEKPLATWRCNQEHHFICEYIPS